MSEAITDWPAPDPESRAAGPPAAERKSRLAVWGVIAGLLLPIVGLVIAIVLFTRGQVGPGLAACLASFLGLIAALALVA